MKLDKRFSNRYQFTASYALSSSRGFFLRGGLPEDQDDWFANPGPQDNDSRHRFTFSGVANLPWGIQGSLIAVYASKARSMLGYPVTLTSTATAWPAIHCLGSRSTILAAGTDADAVVQDSSDNTTANIAKPSNGLIRPLVIAPDFKFGDAFHSQDLRFSKEIRFKERYGIQGLVEIFNVFNVSNLTGYSTTLDVANFSQSSHSWRSGYNLAEHLPVCTTIWKGRSGIRNRRTASLPVRRAFHVLNRVCKRAREQTALSHAFSFSADRSAYGRPSRKQQCIAT